MKVNYLFLILGLVIFNSCKNKNTSTTELPPEVTTKMKVTDIFKKDSVTAFLAAHGEENAEISEKYIQKAEAITKENFSKAEYYYKKAITLWPTDKNYIGLGNLFNDKKKYDAAAEAYQLAIKVNTTQSFDQYLRMIKNDLLSTNYYIQTEFLDNCYALEYNMQMILEKIIADEELKISVSRMKYTSLANVMTNQSSWNVSYQNPDTTGATLEDFIKKFEPVSLPFVCTKKDLYYFSYNRSEMEYEEYDPSTDFSRFMEYSLFKTNYYGETDFQYLIKNGNGKLIVIHAVDTSGSAVPRDMRCIYHRLLVYNNEGKMVDSKIIGAQTGETLVTYKINPDLTIIREAFVRKWKKPFNRSDIDNEIISVEPSSTVNYSVTELGKIVPLSDVL